MKRRVRRVFVLVSVFALVMAWGSFPVLQGQARAEPRNLEGRQASARTSLETNPDACQIPPDLDFLPAAVRDHGSQAWPPEIGRIATPTRQESRPALAPHPGLTPTAVARPPTRVATFGRLPLAFIENQGQVDA